MAASVAGSLASTALGVGAQRLLGGGSGGGSLNIGPSFAAGGRIRAPGGDIVLDNVGPIFGRSDLTQGLLDEIRTVGADATSQLDSLIGRVRPGFGDLTEARVAPITAARQRGVSNLRGNLQRRRLLGSSFAEDSIIRAEREFAEAEQLARAQGLLEELELTTRLIDQRTNSALRAASVELDQNNFELGLTTQVLTGVQSAMTETAKAQAQLAAASAQGAGQFLGFNLNDSLNQAGQAAGAWINDFLNPAVGGGRV